jgi:hypothetical protein
LNLRDWISSCGGFRKELILNDVFILTSGQREKHWSYYQRLPTIGDLRTGSGNRDYARTAQQHDELQVIRGTSC